MTYTLHYGIKLDGRDNTSVANLIETYLEPGKHRVWVDGDDFRVWGEPIDHAAHVQITFTGTHMLFTLAASELLETLQRVLPANLAPDLEANCWPNDERHIPAAVTQTANWSDHVMHFEKGADDSLLMRRA